jgi:outer membrane protein assembly factor BamB
MASTHELQPSPQKPLRLWPGVIAAAALVLFKLVAIPIVSPGAPPVGLLGGLVAALAIVVWWVFFSRALWSERVGAIVLMVVALFATSRVVHESIAKAPGGMLFPILAVPALSFALVVWAVASRRLSTGLRRASMVATMLLTCGVFALLRTSGFNGDGEFEFHWRWTPTPEQRLLAQADQKPLDVASSVPALVEVRKEPPVGTVPDTTPTRAIDPSNPTPDAVRPTVGDGKVTRVERPAMSDGRTARVEWPGFRGASRDGVVRIVHINTDWAKSPPVEMWRRPIGPGWSSFAVKGDLLYTQEQRGDDEIVACHRVSTGEPIWRHGYPARFWEPGSGAGPRGTPTINNGRVYTFGATGILNALDAATGAVVWTRNAAADAEVENPGWGFTSSPLVLNDLVIVAASGRLAAYDAATGQPRWFGPTGGLGYSSPHLVTMGGVDQIVLLRGARTTSVAPADGSVLWEHRWQPGVGMLQPALTAEGDLLIAAADTMGGAGIRRLHLARGPAGWTVEERWTSRGLKPYFNDFITHKGHAYGFDGSILASIDLQDGARKWKGGRYGNGQLVLLPDQDLLLVLSEEGQLALVSATPDQFRELARFQVLDGKTWNHPVLVGDVLLVRNGEEMAAFRLTPARN